MILKLHFLKKMSTLLLSWICSLKQTFFPKFRSIEFVCSFMFWICKIPHIFIKLAIMLTNLNTKLLQKNSYRTFVFIYGSLIWVAFCFCFRFCKTFDIIFSMKCVPSKVKKHINWLFSHSVLITVWDYFFLCHYLKINSSNDDIGLSMCNNYIMK